MPLKLGEGNAAETAECEVGSPEEANDAANAARMKEKRERRTCRIGPRGNSEECADSRSCSAIYENQGSEKRENTRNDDQTPPHNNHKLYNDEQSRA